MGAFDPPSSFLTSYLLVNYFFKGSRSRKKNLILFAPARPALFIMVTFASSRPNGIFDSHSKKWSKKWFFVAYAALSRAAAPSSRRWKEKRRRE